MFEKGNLGMGNLGQFGAIWGRFSNCQKGKKRTVPKFPERNKKMRVRLAGIIPMKDGFAFMHRVGVQNHPIGDYK